MKLNRKIESIDDVKAFISDIAWYYGVEIYDDDMRFKSP